VHKRAETRTRTRTDCDWPLIDCGRQAKIPLAAASRDPSFFSTRLHPDTRPILNNMPPKRPHDADAAKSAKKQKKGFQIGPANLPDGTHRRKSMLHPPPWPPPAHPCSQTLTRRSQENQRGDHLQGQAQEAVCKDQGPRRSRRDCPAQIRLRPRGRRSRQRCRRRTQA
jgi:hypothetical protein